MNGRQGESQGLLDKKGLLLAEWQLRARQFIPTSWEELGELRPTPYTADSPSQSAAALFETLVAAGLSSDEIRDKVVVVIGCAEGFQAEILKQLGARSVVGVDPLLRVEGLECRLSSGTRLVKADYRDTLDGLDETSVDFVIAAQFYDDTTFRDTYGGAIIKKSRSKLQAGGAVIVSANQEPLCNGPGQTTRIPNYVVYRENKP